MTRRLHLIPLSLLTLAGLAWLPAQEKPAGAKPLKALLIAGGCCHDYAKQQEILSKGIQARANVQVDVLWTDDKTTSPNFRLYDRADWAAGYDVIIHDECAADVKDKALVQRILDAHKTIPAVNLHCAMHSFRTGSDMWFKYLGIQSASHGPQEPIGISYVDDQHPITKTLTDWTTIKEELYNNVNVFDAHPLAMGRQMVKGKEVDAIVAWTNEKAGARSFSTTIGHNNDTVADARYLDLVTRGLLWACDKLDDAHLVPFTGTNVVTFFKAEPKPEAPTPAAAAAAAPPALSKDATLVTVTASSEETGKNNLTWHAVDGSLNTRWCAANGDKPQWLQLEFEKPQNLSGIKITWEGQNNAYLHKIEVETEANKARAVLVDATQDTPAGDSSHTFDAKGVKKLIITCTGTSQGGWASIKEVQLHGEGIKSLAPKNAPAPVSAPASAPATADAYKTQGNIPPSIVKLTADQEAAILKDVTIPEGFEATVFAAPPAANYPVFIAAAPNGDLYVSSDGNGSLGRNAKRGRIIRLRDTDNDGRADETKVFCEVDSPRGLVWDHDRLYVVHPPDISAFIDKDGDGVAEETKTLIKGIAFGFKDRPADHTTNGLSLGIDGWLYIAGGDFGFMDAVGTDGRHLQHRGGGVIRFRPDGSGLEIYSTGTRNILEVAISPLMDIFARDNTNDGGGWNVRFHHFTGLDDHGYPRLYKNFADEAIQPLADYGGGSGCGAVYIDEPGFGKWNNAPFTADWGTGALWHHTVKPKGATFEETTPPQPFIKMTRPTDADVDAMSRVYCASWKGATFDWQGPDVGYIVCVKPKGWQLGRAGVPPAGSGVPPEPQSGAPGASGKMPNTAGGTPALPFIVEPLPNFAKASDAELVKLLESPSNRRRMEAQRELGRRTLSDGTVEVIHELSFHPGQPRWVRTAALFTPTKKPLANGYVYWNRFSSATDFQPLALRFAAEHADEHAEKFKDYPKLSNGDLSELSPAALLQLCRLASNSKSSDLKVYVGMSAASDDLVVQHAAIQALAKTQNASAAFELLDSFGLEKHLKSEAPFKELRPRVTKNVLRALAKMHKPEVVAGLIERLNTTTDTTLRHGLLSALCRLHFKEGEWKGDSWGTRPDTRGPYYQPEPWEETPKIAAALKDTLAKASPEEAAFLVSEMNRNRIQSNEALMRILTLAKQDAKLLPDAVSQLASAETIPAEGIPLLITATQTAAPAATASDAEKGHTATLLSNAVIALTKTDSAEGCRSSLGALVTLAAVPDAGKEQEAARTAFLGSPKLENHHQLLELEAEKVGTPTAAWADAALLSLSARTTGSPESKELSGKALDAGWQDAKRRVQILKAVATLKHNPYADKVLASLDDPDKAVADAAKAAAKAMKLQKKTAASGPLIATLKPEDVIAQVVKTKGDVALGEQLFVRQTCVACHTTKESEAQKGPYLGNIAQTYKRPELAQNILDPNKTIAQGFATEVFHLKDGSAQMGFITLEGAESVKVRTITSQEFTFPTRDIAKREKMPISMMPPGLVGNLTIVEFASLLDYMESLVK